MEIDDERREQIIMDHPLLYAENFFFEFGDGWLDLIEKLSHDLEAQIKKWRKDFPKDDIPMCMEAKERKGTLRFSMNIGTPDMWESIDKAQKASRTICDVCGNPGRPFEGRWLKTRCDEHINA